MNDPLQKDQYKRVGVNFDDDEEIEGAAVYHKNPNVGQVLFYRAMSFGVTAAYLMLVTNKRAILVPYNNNMTFTREKVRYVAFSNIKILKENGALEFEVNEKKPLRLSPMVLSNKIRHVDLSVLLKSIRDRQ